jgi:hypothetical protein
MEKKILLIGIVIVIVIIVITLISTKINRSNIINRNYTADSLLTIALEYTKKAQLDSAIVRLFLISDMSQNNFSPAAYDNAIKLIMEIDRFRRDQKEESFRAYISKMNEEEYASLMQNQLKTVYYTNPTLNKALIDTLYVHRYDRNRYILEEKTKQATEKAKKGREFNIYQAARRKAYAEKLRDKFLDQGMDIKVSVYGKNNANIKLIYALFNDVWTHKMQKGTLIKEIQDLGFKKLSLSDGYDYDVYWDF